MGFVVSNVPIKLYCRSFNTFGTLENQIDSLHFDHCKDMFDLVEEVGATFYEYISIDPSATKKEINKQYRTLAKTWHPDRNDSETAGDNFRKLAAVTEVLKNEELRERYDRVLVEGLPSWRSKAYYMRKLRKMSATEVFILVTVIATTIHYCAMWGSYLEKKMILGMLSQFCKLTNI